MDFVDIVLAGRTYRLRFTADDIQDICRRLTTFQPVGGGKVTPTILGTLLLQLDPDALQYCLWAAMRHIAEYKALEAPAAQKLIREHIRRGGQYTDLRRPIFKCLIACGLADFGPIVTILEEEEARLAQDGAVDLDTLEATSSEETEDSRGNGLTPPSDFPMRHSTPLFSGERSDS